MEVPELNGQAATAMISSVGALNWGATEVMNTNYVADLLGTGNVGLAYIAFGAAGAIALLEQFDVVDVTGD